MSYYDTTPPAALSATGAAGLAACWANIQSQPDPWRAAWKRLDRRGRYVLLRLAGLSGHLHGYAWAELGDDSRRRIKESAEGMRAWLAGLTAEGEGAA